MDYQVTLKGQEVLLQHLKKLENSATLFDSSLEKAIANTQRKLVIGSQTKRTTSQSFRYGKETVSAKNLSTGDTARAWTNPMKIRAGAYMTSNNKKSGKYLIVDLIEKGHKEIRPKTKKMLYIPISRKGQMKPAGAKTTGLKVGVDFIMTKLVKARKGTDFMATAVAEGSRDLTRLIIADIRGVFK
jgi:hypothetical protein